MMNMDNDEIREKVNYDVQRNYNIDVEMGIMIIEKKTVIMT